MTYKTPKQMFNEIEQLEMPDGPGIEVHHVVPFYCEKVEQELDYAEKCHNLEEQLGCPLDEAINLLFEGLKITELYNCLTCTSAMHNERGCEGSCEHNKEFSKKEVLDVLKNYVDYHKKLQEDKSE